MIYYVCLYHVSIAVNSKFPRCSPLRDADGLGCCLLHGGDQLRRVAHCKARHVTADPNVVTVPESQCLQRPLDPFRSFW